jgi:predicted dehydrogenase
VRGLPTVSFIGAGNYAGRVLIPAFHKTGARLLSIASNGGVSAAHFGRKFGFKEATSDASGVVQDPRSHIIVVATRHETHGHFVCNALNAGRHVFVEKPLAIAMDEVDAIEAAWLSSRAAGRPQVMVGFNRRFAPHVVRMKSLLEVMRAPKSFIVTVNAGALPGDHWTQTTAGGGRIIGEACHFIDLLRFLAGAPIESWQILSIGGSGGGVRDDKASITLRFADGSIGTIHYLANGHSSFPKERIEVFCGGGILQLDNFRKMRGFGWRGFEKMNLWKQDKGQAACVAAFVAAIGAGRPAPIPFEEIVEVARATILIAQAARA